MWLRGLWSEAAAEFLGGDHDEEGIRKAKAKAKSKVADGPRVHAGPHGYYLARERLQPAARGAPMLVLLLLLQGLLLVMESEGRFGTLEDWERWLVCSPSIVFILWYTWTHIWTVLALFGEETAEERETLSEHHVVHSSDRVFVGSKERGPHKAWNLIYAGQAIGVVFGSISLILLYTRANTKGSYTLAYAMAAGSLLLPLLAQFASALDFASHWLTAEAREKIRDLRTSHVKGKRHHKKTSSKA